MREGVKDVDDAERRGLEDADGGSGADDADGLVGVDNVGRNTGRDGRKLLTGRGELTFVVAYSTGPRFPTD